MLLLLLLVLVLVITIINLNDKLNYLNINRKNLFYVVLWATKKDKMATATTFSQKWLKNAAKGVVKIN